jgi:hypothetical protein
MKENVNKVMRKEMHKMHGKLHQGEPARREDSDVIQLPREGGGGSNSMSSYQKKNSRKNPTTEDSTSFYTSNLDPIVEERIKPSKDLKKKSKSKKKEVLSDRSMEEMSDRSLKREDVKKERPSSKSKLDKTNKLSASFRSGSVAFQAQKGISPYRMYAQEEIKKMQRQR